MGDDHHRDVLLVCQLYHDIQHFLDGLRVEGRSRLVEQDDLGLCAEGACNGDALLLAAGQLRRVDIRFVPEADDLKIMICQLFGLCLGLVMELHGCQRQVFEHRHVGVEVELLEDHAHVVADDLGLVLVGQLLTVDVDVAAGRLFQKVHAADSGRFAAAGRSDNDQLFALGDLEVHVFEDVQVSEVLVNVFEFDHCDPRLSLSCSVVRAPAPRTAHLVRLSRTAHKNEKTKKAQSEYIHLSAFAFVG